jgi:DNA-binding MarR family transcriptional regulator
MEHPGYQLPLLLFGAFRTIIDETHRRLAAAGHPGLRAAHGFALQAIGQGSTTSEVGRRLGISKQAAAKTVDRLIRMGYLVSAADPADARRKLVTPSERGRDVLVQSARIFDQVYAELAETIGSTRLRQLRDDLETLAGERACRLDSVSWLSGSTGD